MTHSLITLTAALLLGTSAQARELPLYTARHEPGTHVTVVDVETRAELVGASVTVPKLEKPRVPNSVVDASRKGDRLTLHWSQAPYAALSVERDKPLNLRPYLKQGTLEFDIDVKDLAAGDLNFAMACSSNKEDCSRSVRFMRPGQALQGKGWQHLSFAMSCFVRPGADFSAITMPIRVEGSGSGQVSIRGVHLRTHGKPSRQCADYRTESVTAEPLETSWSVQWWIPRHEQKLQQARELGASSQLVFIGDSITQGWETSGKPVWDRNYAQYKAFNLGFSGDRTENVLWRLQHGELDGLAPKLVVMMIGTNNTGHRLEDPATTALGVKRLVDEVRARLPDARLLLLAVFPRDEKPGDRMRQINNGVNERIAQFADGQHVLFLDLNATFLQPDGTLSREVMPDLLHPQEAGYELWAKAMQPTLEKLLTQ